LRDRIRLTGNVRRVRQLARPTGVDTLDAVVKAERERAFEAGFEAGRAAERSDATGRLDDACERLAESRTAAEAELATTAVSLATAITRALLRTELDHGGYDIETMVRETLAEAGVGRNACVVHLNPTDYARLADARFRSGTKIEADEGVPLADVHVETSLGLLVRETLDAVDAIEARLLEDLA